MKKLFLAISAMFLFLADSPAWSQWPDFDLDSRKPFQATVDDGFGGIWRFTKFVENQVIVRRQSNGFSVFWNSDGRYYFNDNLEFDEKSLPMGAGLPIAFYGYLTELNNKDVGMTVYLYVNPETGDINEVLFDYKLYGHDKIWHSVPPRNFTLYEDILKKTVKFKPPHGIFDPEKMKEWHGSDYRENPEDGIYYVYRVEFPAPAEGEPDFLALPTAADK